MNRCHLKGSKGELLAKSQDGKTRTKGSSIKPSDQLEAKNVADLSRLTKLRRQNKLLVFLVVKWIFWPVTGRINVADFARFDETS